MFTDQQTSQRGKEMIDRHRKKKVKSRGRKSKCYNKIRAISRKVKQAYFGGCGL
jgi:hypothetical protein